MKLLIIMIIIIKTLHSVEILKFFYHSEFKMKSILANLLRASKIAKLTIPEALFLNFG